MRAVHEQLFPSSSQTPLWNDWSEFRNSLRLEWCPPRALRCGQEEKFFTLVFIKSKCDYLLCFFFFRPETENENDFSASTYTMLGTLYGFDLISNRLQYRYHTHSSEIVYHESHTQDGFKISWSRFDWLQFTCTNLEEVTREDKWTDERSRNSATPLAS